MSLINEQVKKLREAADFLFNAYFTEQATQMRQAADTIEILSAKLQVANSMIEAMAEEIENCYGRETELTGKAREYINNQNKGESL